MPKSLLVATFDDPEALLSAVPPIRAARLKIVDVYAPYPIHGLDEAMGIRRTRLPFVTLFVGVCGLAFALCFQFYGAVLDWPLDVGGKPDNSTLAFVPICFELTVLTSALLTVAALFLRARLYPGQREQLLSPGITDNEFVLAIRRPEADTARHLARSVLSTRGAIHIDEREVES